MDITDSVGSQEVVADKEKIARVVFNLLSNALKYTPAGGDIFVSLKDEDGKFRLDVRDTGKGISQEEAGKISSVSSRLREQQAVRASAWLW